jgi:carboxymethylenebutenolidase
MGEMVEFASNGGTGQGYLAGGGGPGVVVIQEWWGLVPHIKDVCDRFAAEGFVALAPDLYHGETTSEPDEAGKKLMALNLGAAAKDMSGAVDYVRERSSGDGVGVVGFCMGGGLALVLACQRPDAVKACAPFYGIIPWPETQPDWPALAAKVRGHYAEKDGFFGPEGVRALEAQLKDLGKDVELTIHPGVDHAFFNDTRPEVYDAEASAKAWAATIAFFRDTLG